MLGMGMLIAPEVVRGQESPGTNSNWTGKTRVYYIGALKADWDYAPSKQNLLTNTPLQDDPDARVFTVAAPDRIGRVYTKARYVEFTDASFTTTRASLDAAYRAKWQHLGILGPVIHAEVGDRVRVVFKNMTPAADKLSLSIHVHGLKYAKSSEGAPYADGTVGKDKLDDRIAPGQTYTYNYDVPEDAGPASMDTDSVIWMYHSHVNEILDTYTGLIGAIIVTARGAAREDGSPKSVTREFVNLYQVFNENKSLYLRDNLKRLPKRVDPQDEGFQESNLMHAINGFVYGNLPGLTVRLGERVRWYVMGMGTEVDLHTPHWHGQTVTSMGQRMDMLELLPGSMKVADMVPRTPGTWWMHCHVNDHIAAGMGVVYTVLP